MINRGNTRSFEDFIKEKVEREKNALLSAMKYAGEGCIDNARRLGTYQDQTGNLRSSIGYGVYVDGELVNSAGFEAVKNGGEGTKVGYDFLKDISFSYPNSVILVVVAGMKYAIWVEARGYNVLTSSRLYADIMIPKLLDELGIKWTRQGRK